jgi:hypothetical protein
MRRKKVSDIEELHLQILRRSKQKKKREKRKSMRLTERPEEIQYARYE